MMQRRFFSIAAFLFGLVSAPGYALAQCAADVPPGAIAPGEIRIEGVVQKLLPDRGRLVLLVSRVTLPDGTTRTIDPPRSKTVVYKQGVSPGLKAGDSAAVIGGNRGVGAELSARAVQVLPAGSGDRPAEAASGPRVAGRVFNAAGTPVAGAAVILLENPSAPNATTDGQGRFTLRAPAETPAREAVTVLAAHTLGFARARGAVGGAPLSLKLTPPTFAPAPGDLERGYALLDSVKREGVRVTGYPWYRLFLELAPYDPERALKLGVINAGELPEWNVAQAVAVLAQTDPVRAAEWGLPRLREIEDLQSYLYAAPTLGLALAGAHPDRARQILGEIQERLRAAPGPAPQLEWVRFKAAALAGRLRDAQAQRMVDEALAAAPRPASNPAAEIASGKRIAYAEIVAAGSATLAAAMLSPLGEAERPYALARVIQAAAVHDVDGARDLLSKLEALDPPTEPGKGAQFAAAARAVVEALGPRDSAVALALAHKVTGPQRALALAAAVRHHRGAAALDLLREAADAAEESDTRTLGEIAGLSRDADSLLSVEILAKARQPLRPDSPPRVVAPIAYYLASVDPIQSRLLLESVWARRGPGSDRPDPSASLAPLILAMAPLDLDRALAMAASLPDRDASVRLDTQRKIAQYVLAPETLRRRISFERWSTSSTWIPGLP